MTFDRIHRWVLTISFACSLTEVDHICTTPASFVKNQHKRKYHWHGKNKIGQKYYFISFNWHVVCYGTNNSLGVSYVPGYSVTYFAFDIPCFSSQNETMNFIREMEISILEICVPLCNWGHRLPEVIWGRIAFSLKKR